MKLEPQLCSFKHILFFAQRKAVLQSQICIFYRSLKEEGKKYRCFGIIETKESITIGSHRDTTDLSVKLDKCGISCVTMLITAGP